MLRVWCSEVKIGLAKRRLVGYEVRNECMWRVVSMMSDERKGVYDDIYFVVVRCWLVS